MGEKGKKRRRETRSTGRRETGPSSPNSVRCGAGPVARWAENCGRPHGGL